MLDEKPERFQDQTDPMFYGVVQPDDQVQSIKGMSGGPILGLKMNDDGSARYWFIAVQSGWYPSDRVVCATRLAAVREILITGMEMMFAGANDDSAS
jgi:hypothetical protein